MAIESPGKAERRSRRAILLSAGAHLLVFALLLLPLARPRVRTVATVSRGYFPGIEVAGASHATRLELPMALNTVEARKPAREPETARKIAAPTPQPPKPAAGSAAPTQHTGQGAGDAANGNGSDAENADPAFPVFSPRPPVTDRALLPGTEQQIVVDVDLNAQGDVVGANLVKGMGNQLDQIVLSTVKTWRFHPATVNGNPVASQAELIFPFSSRYPISPA